MLGRIFDPSEYECKKKTKKKNHTARSIWKIAVKIFCTYSQLHSYCNRKLSKEIIRFISLFTSDSNQHWLWAPLFDFMHSNLLLPILTLTPFFLYLSHSASVPHSFSFLFSSIFPFSRSLNISNIKSFLYFIRSFSIHFECCKTKKKGYILYNGANSVAYIPYTSFAFDCWTMPFRSGRGTKMDTQTQNNQQNKKKKKNLILKLWMTLVCEYF